ncbi:hypothetical protein Tco_0936486 [Tanacetum coccineum]
MIQPEPEGSEGPLKLNGSLQPIKDDSQDLVYLSVIVYLFDYAKDNKEEDEEEEDEEVEESLDSDSESEDAEDKGPTAEDEDPALGEEGDTAVPKGQQRATPVVETAVGEPLGLGYGALRRQEIALGEGRMPSVFEVGESLNQYQSQRDQKCVGT